MIQHFYIHINLMCNISPLCSFYPIVTPKLHQKNYCLESDIRISTVLTGN